MVRKFEFEMVLISIAILYFIAKKGVMPMRIR